MLLIDKIAIVFIALCLQCSAHAFTLISNPLHPHAHLTIFRHRLNRSNLLHVVLVHEYISCLSVLFASKIIQLAWFSEWTWMTIYSCLTHFSLYILFVFIMLETPTVYPELNIYSMRIRYIIMSDNVAHNQIGKCTINAVLLNDHAYMILVLYYIQSCLKKYNASNNEQ